MSKLTIVASSGVCGDVIKGVLNKEELKVFKHQRNLSYFTIDQMSESKFKKIFTEVPGWYYPVDLYGFIVFPDEEEIIFSSFDQLIIDTYSMLTSLVKSFDKVKFDDDEIEIVDKFIFFIKETIEYIDGVKDYDEEVFEHHLHIDMKKFVYDNLKNFGIKEL